MSNDDFSECRGEHPRAVHVMASFDVCTSTSETLHIQTAYDIAARLARISSWRRSAWFVIAEFFFLLNWVHYPQVGVEDPMLSHSWAGWTCLTKLDRFATLGCRVMYCCLLICNKTCSSMKLRGSACLITVRSWREVDSSVVIAIV